MKKPILHLLLCIAFSWAMPLSGQELFPFKFSEESNKWGYKDSTGNILIYWHFDEADSFNSSGYAKVKYNGLYGYINKTPDFVISPEYEALGPMIKDSIWLDDQHYIIKKVNAFVVIDKWLETETYYDYFPKLAGFRYPNHEDLVSDLKKEQYKKDLGLKNQETSGKGYGVLSISSMAPPSEVRLQSGFVNFDYYSSKDLIKEKLRLGAGMVLGSSILWERDSVIKSNIIGIGLSQKVILTKQIGLSFSLYPIFSRNTFTRKRGDVTFNSYADNYSLGVIADGSFNLIIRKGLMVSVGYRSIPIYKGTHWKQAGFFSYGLGLEF